MNLREKKKLISDIDKLDNFAHEKIFEIILNKEPKSKYSQNSQGILLSLNDIDNDILLEIQIFINQYREHINYSNERDLLYTKAKESVDNLLEHDYEFNEIINRK